MAFSNKKCVPCEGGVKPLSQNEVKKLLSEIEGWQTNAEFNSILKDIKFRNFEQALEFVNKVGKIAEEQNHHPDIKMGWGYCSITLQTHSIGGLHENDFIVAAKINEIK
ncbi:MAG: 4a-hydroxytetrahydrobiopterin dehydratase [Rickettsiales bacterium]|nr:4a-hydroxytetrahydrobiopterin dehydratase [Pseudomonadota bacterium]MDA0967115.1 4a-hydroxytetrahydrobiopterin dehydratase [Pseudomonadota bacterium]MDG4542399.1 4a-hydroxytetrahydrobiopterin dehydratase [Rickettsiales bacterium]MDG4544903.1 4a-hydroxytetrahydrobiopterin dehydratase [Rickettsiales bacterium]MDG4547026.1 4a-hydroxytetrahydrobiopterin dehydratase [Rickettsiales bacterium]